MMNEKEWLEEQLKRIEEDQHRLKSIEKKLIEMRNVALEAADHTITAEERKELQKAFSQLEIDLDTLYKEKRLEH